MIKIRPIDPAKWAKAPELFKRLAKRLPEVAEQIVSDAVDAGHEALVGAITGSGSRLRINRRALNPIYVARKQGKPLLVKSGEYVQQIKKVHQKGLHGLRMSSEPVPRGGGIKYTDLARFLEFGTRRMAPIEHWGPTQTFIVNRIRNRFRAEAKRAVRGD